MSKTDSLESLQQEYQMLCAKAGELQYQAKQLDNFLIEANQKLEQVNKKYAALKQSLDATKGAPASAPVPAEIINAVGDVNAQPTT